MAARGLISSVSGDLKGVSSPEIYYEMNTGITDDTANVRASNT